MKYEMPNSEKYTKILIQDFRGRNLLKSGENKAVCITIHGSNVSEMSGIVQRAIKDEIRRRKPKRRKARKIKKWAKKTNRREIDRMVRSHCDSGLDITAKGIRGYTGCSTKASRTWFYKIKEHPVIKAHYERKRGKYAFKKE